MKYNKPPGKRELHLIHEDALEHNRNDSSESSSLLGIKGHSNTYMKIEGEREPQLYVLFVEGDRKEPEYFKLMQGIHSFSGLKITYMPLANCAEYQGNLAKKMCEVVNKSYVNESVTIDKETYSIHEIDHVFIVMDVDNLHDEISDGIKMEQRAAWIISNPCFEIWLYYAFHNSPDRDLCYENIEVSKRSSNLKTDLNTVHRGGIGCKIAFEKMQDAIHHAEQHYQLDNDGVPCLYATGMYLLAIKIYNIIRLPLEKRLLERKKQIDKFRKDNSLDSSIKHR